jgi:hypothetical protein
MSELRKAQPWKGGAMETPQQIADRDAAIARLTGDLVQLDDAIIMLMRVGCSQRTMADLRRMRSEWSEQIDLMVLHQEIVKG